MSFLSQKFGPPISALASGGIYGLLKQQGVQTPSWMDKPAQFLQDPNVNAALGMVGPMRGMSPLMREVIARGRSGRPMVSGKLPGKDESILEKGMERATVKTKQEQEIALKKIWEKHGPPLDFEEVWQTASGDRAWKKLVNSYNEKYGTDFDPDNMPMNEQTRPIFDAYDKAFLYGKKAKFPGISKANEYFEGIGQLDKTVYLPKDLERPELRQ